MCNTSTSSSSTSSSSSSSTSNFEYSVVFDGTALTSRHALRPLADSWVTWSQYQWLVEGETIAFMRGICVLFCLGAGHRAYFLLVCQAYSILNSALLHRAAAGGAHIHSTYFRGILCWRGHTHTPSPSLRRRLGVEGRSVLDGSMVVAQCITTRCAGSQAWGTRCGK